MKYEDVAETVKLALETSGQDKAPKHKRPRLLSDNGGAYVSGDLASCRYGGRGVVVETIARFKGLDSAAVILVLNELAETPDVSAYIGFSRARSYLQVIGPSDRQRPCNWLSVRA